jgi:hypothetical protein
MNRSQARMLWQRIADGGLTDQESPDTGYLHTWIRGVALKVLKADDVVDPKMRPGRVVAAVGLSGKPDGYAALREIINDPIWEFPVLADGVALEETRGQLIQKIMEMARERGVLEGSYADDDTKAKDLIRRLLPK